MNVLRCLNNWEVTFWPELFQPEPTVEEMALDSIRRWQEPQPEPSNGVFYQEIARTQPEPLFLLLLRFIRI